MLRPMTHQERVAKFGRFSYVPAPIATDAEAIKITDSWPAHNIVAIEVPWGRPHRHLNVHRLAAEQISALWADWAEAGLMDRILTINGAWAPRYKRGRTGSDESLSNHAWGSAFDLNALWNRMGHPPAPVGARGCLLDLVPAMARHGMIWGGTFTGSRIDPMHVEVGISG